MILGLKCKCGVTITPKDQKDDFIVPTDNEQGYIRLSGAAGFCPNCDEKFAESLGIDYSQIAEI